MGIDRFQANFRPWLEKVYWKRREILRPEGIPNTAWFPMTGDPENDCREVGDRIYSFYSWNYIVPTKRNRLFDATRVPAYDPHIFRHHQGDGASGYDSDFLYFKPTVSMMAPVARLYFNYRHSNLQKSRLVARYFQWEMASGARGVVRFKISGPEMPEYCGNSAVVWLTPHGARMRKELVKTAVSLVRMDRPTHYGVEELGKGVGFAYEPRKIDPADWKYRHSRGGRMSFGLLLTAYLAEAIAEHPASVDVFVDRVGDLMEADGMNLSRMFELSERLRMPEVRELPDFI